MLQLLCNASLLMAVQQNAMPSTGAPQGRLKHCFLSLCTRLIVTMQQVSALLLHGVDERSQQTVEERTNGLQASLVQRLCFCFSGLHRLEACPAWLVDY